MIPLCFFLLCSEIVVIVMLVLILWCNRVVLRGISHGESLHLCFVTLPVNANGELWAFIGGTCEANSVWFLDFHCLMVLLVCRKLMWDFIVCCHHSACQERPFWYDQFIDALYLLTFKLSTVCNGKIVKTTERTIISFSFFLKLWTEQLHITDI